MFTRGVIVITGGGKALDTETCVSTSQRTLPTKPNTCEMEYLQNQGAPRPSCSTKYDLFRMCTFRMFNLYTLAFKQLLLLLLLLLFM